ncbi:MAG: PD-(D/E)XK nuclease family protein [Gemmatimonadetes bacterium]|nr:PD-(D/E)XK nuclease family protein [Gemmatimonadota bacterium]
MSGRRGSPPPDQLGFGFLDEPPPRATDSAAVATPDVFEPAGSGPARLVGSLARATRAAPQARKILVAATRGEGRELLRALVRAGTPWIGWEVTTPRPLAVECVGATLAEQGVRLLDEFEEQALLDEAIDVALERTGDTDLGPGPEAPSFNDLSEALGFRRALAGAVQAMRLGGLGVGDVARAGFADPHKQALLRAALASYERALARMRAADSARVLADAAARVRTDAAALPDAQLHLVPGLGARGRAGEFLAALRERGAQVLATDPVVGLDAPSGWIWSAEGEPGPLGRLHASGSVSAPVPGLDLFAAASVEEELREVLRRALGAGLPWDEVEIVTPDAQVYGSALHALAERLGVPVTFGVGLQVARTRPGRALATWFRWIEGGFHAAEIRRLLEAGDLRPPAEHSPDGMTLSRRFRSLRIGWGRERTAARLRSRRAVVERVRARADAPDPRQEQAALELDALAALLEPILDGIPPLPDHPLDRSGPRVSPAALAVGLRRFLTFVPAENAVDQTAWDRLDRVLARVEATLRRETHYAAAAAALRAHLQIRVPAPRAEGKAPWSSDGGHVYLTDLEHGGYTGRAATFVVGMDADRFPGADTQDPLLLDRERMRLGRSHLPTSGDRIHERRFLFAALLARLRGRVTVSWCGWEPSEARTRSPASEVLLACRLRTGDPEASFETVRALVGAPVATIPRATAEDLDARDVWMRALGHGGVLRDGVGVVRRGYAALEQGWAPFAALESEEASAYLGNVAQRAGFDLRRTQDVVSASRLEALGQCPRRFLYASILRTSPPDDPEYDPDRWLDARSQGTLLHRVYERLLREARARGIGPDAPELLDRARRILAEEAERTLEEVPTPSEEIRQRELGRLEDDLRAFTGLLAETGRTWLDLEVKFGLGGLDPLPLPVDGGRVLVRGQIDRVDAAEEGLYVVDYKTGGTYAFESERGAFHGARRLQHYVYWVAVRRIYGRPVAAMEYQFPTHRAANARIRYTEEELRAAPEILGRLLDTVAGGHFLPTDDPGDCRFCDFRPVCRVTLKWTGEVEDSPPARWAQRFGASSEAYAAFRYARRREDEGPPGLLPPPSLETLLGGDDG